MFNWAAEAGYITANPIRRVRKPRAPRTPRPLVTPEQVGAAVEAAPHPDARLALLVLAGTGMRVSELCALAWGRLDLDAGVALLVVTKEGRPRRAVLPTPVVAELARQRDELGPGPEDRAIPRHRETVRWWVAEAGRRAGVHLYPDLLRHFHATRLVGVDPTSLARRLRPRPGAATERLGPPRGGAPAPGRRPLVGSLVGRSPNRHRPGRLRPWGPRPRPGPFGGRALAPLRGAGAGPA
jgi:integrase